MATTKNFWNWFVDNNKDYLDLDSIGDSYKDTLLDSMLMQIHKYDDHLYFEIGGHPDADRELIITAEGNKEYFSAVTKLIADAPTVPGWTFVAFKQAIPGHFSSNWDGVELTTEDMFFYPLASESTPGIGIKIYLKNFETLKGETILETLIFKMLETIVGEKSFAEDIDYIDEDYQSVEGEEEDLISIIDLPDYIQWHKSHDKRRSG